MPVQKPFIFQVRMTRGKKAQLPYDVSKLLENVSIFWLDGVLFLHDRF